MRTPRIPQQLIPLAFIFAAAITALIVARSILVPPSFGEYGHYRADAVDEVAAQEIVYAGHNACAECHDDIAEEKQMSAHSNVTCEVCHGAAAQHVEEPDEYSPTVPRGRGQCPLCHGYDPSRPSGFPQIIPVQHNPGEACMTCHAPHNPLLPHAPEDCSACHRQIASEKMVSHHSPLTCTKCHETPDEHLSNPSATKAGKPATNALCGECHAEDAESSRDIPRVDMAVHGERYLCWDCHYPHFPEANR